MLFEVDVPRLELGMTEPKSVVLPITPHISCFTNIIKSNTSIKFIVLFILVSVEVFC